MPYRPTGRAPGRPRGPVTPSGRVDKARKDLPHVKAFPHLRRAVDRSLTQPECVLYRQRTADSREVRLTYRYTPQERGQILAFVWWVYVNRNSWTRNRLKSAVTSISPLMLFSSAFLMDMTGLPRTTTQKCMVKAQDVPAARVTGTCDMWVIHQLLEAATQGLDEYRHKVRELSLMKGVPSALLSRISGVPSDILRRPDRGVQFFPEDPDLVSGTVCTTEQHQLFYEYHPERRKSYDPQPGDQQYCRDSLRGHPLADLRSTTVPLPDNEQSPFHLAIPGLPSRKAAESEYYKTVFEWEEHYQLPALRYQQEA